MSSLALYRTYRPSRFADVVGQEHVTGPLMRALENGRMHHAYLFSGPRGCGKTSSARILARSLNCEKGPAPEPCGECQSCLDLAPGGAGSIDVIELDAATHGLVDDARDLREKAHFSPVSSRYKVYIIDEAHQLGPGAANALLKLIEEPPAHLTFIFATTAPDKILPTIRSRTHHYPFRLIPAKVLQQNLAWICEQEGVAIEPAALALVARAGAGSARDAQSVLGQLIAGADERGVTYDLAVALLGFTDAALLDQVVDAIADADPPTVFSAVDRVMESGHDPRRFLTDLLERFRDLVVMQAVPDAAKSGLIDAPEDQAERMSGQAARFGVSDLVRLADVVDEGITAMKGATPTRLQLELVCARLLLPGADHSVAGVQARLDRLERRVGGAGGSVAEARASTGSEPAPPRRPSAPKTEPAESSAEHAAPTAPTLEPRVPAPAETTTPEDVSGPAREATPLAAEKASPAAETASHVVEASRATEAVSPAADDVADDEASAPAAEPLMAEPEGAESGGVEPGVAEREGAEPGGVEPPAAGSDAAAPAIPELVTPFTTPPPTPSTPPTTSSGAGGVTLGDLRRMWPEVLVRLREIKITPWSLISQESAVADFADGRLTLAFRKPNLRDTFTRRQDFQDFLVQAVKDVLLIEVQVDAIVDPSADPSSASGGGAPSSPAPSAPADRSAAADPVRDPAATGKADAAKKAARRGRTPATGADDSSDPTRPGGEDPEPRPVDDLDADPDDADLDDAGMTERQLLEQTLGATVIDEVDNPR